MARTSRRQLLTNTVAAVGAASIALKAEAQKNVTASGPYFLAAEQGHAGSPWSIHGGPPFLSKVASEDVKGRYALVEINTPPGRGPELHVHTYQNELFFMLGGSIGIQCGSDKKVLQTGDSYMAPMNVPHAFVALGTAPAHILNLFDPAGQIDQFFPAYVHALNMSDPPDREEMAAVYAHHGLKVVGPPLTASDFKI